MTRESGSAAQSSVAVRAEAAAWIARLHGNDRTAADEQSFQRWLAADPVHPVVFERMTELWEQSSRLKSNVLSRQRGARSRAQGTWGRQAWLRASAACLLIAVVALAFLVPGLGGTTLSSGVGERRTVTLDDGTRVTLNTVTRLRVSFDRSQRRVLLQSGEARFDVARNEAWPFVVAVGEQEVRALGTSFTVRKIVDDIAITLIEGKVSVTPAEPSSTAVPWAPAEPAVSNAVVLAPGQRLTLSTDRPATLDRPDIERATAWQRGLISLDQMSLADAVAEMNRYSRLTIEIGEGASDVRVSGVFQAGDSVEFARALAKTHGLAIREEPERIVISRHAR